MGSITSRTTSSDPPAVFPTGTRCARWLLDNSTQRSIATKQRDFGAGEQSWRDIVGRRSSALQRAISPNPSQKHRNSAPTPIEKSPGKTIASGLPPETWSSSSLVSARIFNYLPSLKSWRHRLGTSSSEWHSPPSVETRPIIADHGDLADCCRRPRGASEQSGVAVPPVADHADCALPAGTPRAIT